MNDDNNTHHHNDNNENNDDDHHENNNDNNNNKRSFSRISEMSSNAPVASEPQHSVMNDTHSNKTASTTTKQTTKKKKKKRRSSMPRRPMSAYDIYFQQERMQWHHRPQDHSGTKAPRGGQHDALVQMEQSIVSRWKALSVEARETFEARARNDLARYEQEMEEYNLMRLHPTISWGGLFAQQNGDVSRHHHEPYSSLSDGSSSPSADGGDQPSSQQQQQQQPSSRAALPANLASFLNPRDDDDNDDGAQPAPPPAHQQALSALFMSMLSQDQIVDLRQLLQQLDQVLHQMSEVQGLVVVSPSSSQASKDDKSPPMDISMLMGFLQQLQSRQNPS